MIHIIFLLLLLLTLITNFITLYFFPTIGLIVNSFSIMLYLLLAVYDIYDIYARDILALAGTFILINLINIFLHLSDLYTNTLLIYMVLLCISLIFCFKIFHEKRFFRLKNLRHSYIILLGPLIGGAISYFIPFSHTSLSLTQFQTIGLLVLVAFSEEIFFRALIQNAVTSMTDNIIAIPFTGILYALFHFSNNMTYTLLFLTLSLIYSTMYSIWKNIYITIGLNLATSLTFYLLTVNLLPIMH